MYDDLPDDDLLQHCRAGRQAAWSTLVRRYQRLVYTVPRRMGLADEACADVFQTTFARLVEHLARIEDAARVRAWLVTTARRESLRVLEAGRRFVDLGSPGADEGDGDAEGDPLDRLPDPAARPEDQLGDLQQQDRMRRAVEMLDARSRQFVELLFLQEEPLPYEEIARRLGMAEGSIGPTRARCLAKLRALLERLP